MRSLSLLLLNTLFALACQAQSSTYALPAGKAVLQLPYAHKITVHAWDKAELQFNVAIVAASEALKKLHTIQVENGKDSLYIATDFNWNFNSPGCAGCDSAALFDGKPVQLNSMGKCLCMQLDYEIYLPVNAALSVKTISGDIEVRGLNGALALKTISGFIDLDCKTSVPADLDFHDISGMIYTDFDIALDPESSEFGKKVNTQLNGGGKLVSVETISGDIFFRKQ